jgi:hypothetical protein
LNACLDGVCAGWRNTADAGEAQGTSASPLLSPSLHSRNPNCAQCAWHLLLGLEADTSEPVQKGRCSTSDAEKFEGGPGVRRADEDARGVREKADMARKVARLLDAEREGGMAVAKVFLSRFYVAESFLYLESQQKFVTSFSQTTNCCASSWKRKGRNLNLRTGWILRLGGVGMKASRG